MSTFNLPFDLKMSVQESQYKHVFSQAPRQLYFVAEEEGENQQQPKMTEQEAMIEILKKFMKQKDDKEQSDQSENKDYTSDQETDRMTTLFRPDNFYDVDQDQEDEEEDMEDQQMKRAAEYYYEQQMININRRKLSAKIHDKFGNTVQYAKPQQKVIKKVNEQVKTKQTKNKSETTREQGDYQEQWETESEQESLVDASSSAKKGQTDAV